MTVVEDIGRELRQAYAAFLGIKVRIVPAKESVNFGEGAELPCVVLQGPTIRNDQFDGRIDEVVVGQNPEGQDLYGLKRWRQRVDIGFMIHLATNRMTTDAGGTRLLPLLVAASGAVHKITVGSEDYGVNMDVNFDEFPTPNLSNLQRWQSVVYVEGVELRPDDTDDTVVELVTPYVVGEKKEAG